MARRSRTRVGWNLLALRREALGGWVYVQGILDAAAAHDAGWQLTAFVTEESRLLVQHLTSVELVQLRVRSDIRALRVAAEHALLPVLAKRHELSCLHNFSGTAPPLRGLATALTVYDLLIFHRPASTTRLKRWYLRHAVPASIQRADALLPISEATAADVRRHFPVGRAHVAVIPPIIGKGWYPATDAECAALRQEFSLPPKFWLYVAAGYEHKNHHGLFHALAILRAAGHEPWPLVLRGVQLELQIRRAAEFGVADLVHIAPPMNQDQMRVLIGAAAACIFPSLFEGAGIPGLEAMACAAPLIASDIPTSREFLSGYAELFDPSDPHQIAEAMLRVQRNPPVRDGLRALGNRQLQRQRPAAVASTLFSAYDAAISRSINS
ncbi:MAG: glycosyltransferase family 1 protein [Gemmatimonadaceae bacterium]